MQLKLKQKTDMMFKTALSHTREHMRETSMSQTLFLLVNTEVFLWAELSWRQKESPDCFTNASYEVC